MNSVTDWLSLPVRVTNPLLVKFSNFLSVVSPGTSKAVLIPKKFISTPVFSVAGVVTLAPIPESENSPSL